GPRPEQWVVVKVVVGVWMVGPELIEDVIVIVMVVQVFADVVGHAPQVLLPLCAALAAVVGQVRPQAFTIGDSHPPAARRKSPRRRPSRGQGPVLQVTGDC